MKSIKKIIEEIEKEIKEKVKGKAIIAVSGGVDSTTLTLIAYNALAQQLIPYFIDTGFMRKNEYENLTNILSKFGIEVKYEDAKTIFFEKLKDAENCKEKRKIFSDTFYLVFGNIIEREKAEWLLQGTNKADLEMKAKGQLQHNVRDDYRQFGIKEVLEPFSNFYKHEIRKIAREVGLPKEIYLKQPFPGPGFSIRVKGKITKEKIDLVREAQDIVEKLTKDYGISQTLVRLDEKIPDVNGEEKYVAIIRFIKTNDFLTANPVRINKNIEKRIVSALNEIGIGRVYVDITPKPPAIIEWC